MEDRQARHIGAIISECYNFGPANKPRVTARPADRRWDTEKIPRSLLDGVLDMLATIGWFVTLPFIARDG